MIFQNMPEGTNRMFAEIEKTAWGALNIEEKTEMLFEQQKQMLSTLLSCNAISPAEYERSLRLLENAEKRKPTVDTVSFLGRTR